MKTFLHTQNMMYKTVIKVSLLLAILLLVNSSVIGQSADSYYESGQQKMKNKDVKGALADFTKAIQLNPKYELAFVSRALCRMATGSWNEAIQDSNQAIELNSKQAVAYFVRGCAKANIGKNGCSDLRQSLELGYALAQKGLNQFCN